MTHPRGSRPATDQVKARLLPEERADLDLVAEALGLDGASTVRALIAEKAAMIRRERAARFG